MAKQVKNRRTDTERAHDLPAIARMYLEGYSQTEIAAKFGVTQQQISRDIASMRESWTEEAKRELHEATTELVLQTRSVRKEAWEAWRGGDGEVDFLNAILKTIEAEGKLRGAYTNKHEVSGTQNVILLKTNLDEQLAKLKQ